MSSYSTAVVANHSIEFVVLLSGKPKLLRILHCSVELDQHIVLVGETFEMELS